MNMSERDQQTKLVKLLRGGRITIPAEFRRRLGITQESVLEMSLAAGELRIRVVEGRRPTAGSQWLKDLYALYAPARDEAIGRGYTDDEIDVNLDAAVTAVRGDGI
jgi:bifunctional DNA-binding transcriptional regulator/antitoxin component of YhaV-PrlF toxin-antitoxin module